mgnify:CR=1 FL=1
MAKEELEDIIEYEDYEADYIEEPEELSDNDKVVQNSKGQVKFKSVNHSKRAEANEVETDGEIATYANYALEYFNYRCALSGEKFVIFDEPIQRGKNNKLITNLSAEHILALTTGGNDIIPNIVPSVYQYNIQKNGYYILDWWTKAKDINGNSIYSPEKLLKLVNYMLKSLQARKELGIKKQPREYRKRLLKPNEIDEFLNQEEIAEKVLSDTITSTTQVEDGKNILTQIPQQEGEIPSLAKQKDKETKITEAMFLTDALEVLQKEEKIPQEVIVKLQNMYKEVEGEIPFEIEVRKNIISALEQMGIENNKYTVANSLLVNTNLLEKVRENKEEIQNIIKEYIRKSIEELKGVLTEESIKEIISYNPEVLYNEEAVNQQKETIELYKMYINKDIKVDILNQNYLINALKVRQWMEKNNTIKPPKRYNKSDSKEETQLAIQLDTIKQQLIKPYNKLETEDEKEEYKKQHPELDDVMKIIEWIDKNNVKVKEDSQYYWHVLAIKEWMEKNNTTKPPRAQNQDKTIPKEEGILGSQLSAIRQQLIKPYSKLKTEEEKEEYKKQHPELDEVMEIIEWIDNNNIKVKEDSAFYWNALKIKEWMEKNNTKKPPSKNSKESLEEKKLGQFLANIRQGLIKPYNKLETEAEKEEYRKEHPELDDVMEIIEWIDENNVKVKEDSQYYWRIIAIKEWMEENNTTRPPRCQTSSKTIPEKEGELGTQLSNIRRFLILPYIELENEEDKEAYKEEHPEIEYVMGIVEWIDKNNIKAKEDSKDYKKILEIKKWMEENNTTKPPRGQNNNKTVPEEEAKLGGALANIRNQLIKPYYELEDDEEKENYKIEHPEFEDIVAIIEWIDKNNIKVKEDSHYYWDILEIKKWMEENNSKRPPRCQNPDKTIPEEEARLGNNLSKIRQNLIKPYSELENEEEKEEYKKKHPELKEVMSIIETIDSKEKEDSKYYWNILAIREWMKKNNTTRPPRGKGDNKDISEEEGILGNQLRQIRHYLIKPYKELESENEKEEYKKKHPELEEIIMIVEEIDRNNVRLKEDSAFYWNALKIKEWMEKNQATQPPRSQYKSRKTGKNAVPVEEARLGDKLSEIRMNLISPYLKLETEKDKESYRMEHPELEEVLEIIGWIDNRIPEKLQQARDIKKWMEKNNTTNPPRATIRRNNKALRLEDMDDIEKEEYIHGTALRRIRTKLIEPYNKLESDEEKELYKQNNPELEEVMAIVEEIDWNNPKNKKKIKDTVKQNKGNLSEAIQVGEELEMEILMAEKVLERSASDGRGQ